MTISSTRLTDELYDCLLRVGVREQLVMAWLRAERRAGRTPSVPGSLAVGR